MTEYVDPIDEDDHVMTVEEFKEDCASGGFIDYDGFGYPAKDGKTASGGEHRVYPSERGKIPADATHIVWYNR
jgi:hypothetical protein